MLSTDSWTKTGILNRMCFSTPWQNQRQLLSTSSVTTRLHFLNNLHLLLLNFYIFFKDLLGKVTQLGADINRGDNSLSKGTAKRILTNKAKPTVSDAFRVQLQVLVEVLQSTNSW